MGLFAQNKVFILSYSEEKENFCLGDGAQNLPEVGDALLRFPGQKFTADQQCQLMHGTASYYCAVSLLNKNSCVNILTKIMNTK